MSVTKNKKIRVSIKSKKALETHCKWCGKPFKKHHNRQMYCGDDCSTEGEKENTRKRRVKHYHKYKFSMHEAQKYGLGSGFLSMYRKDDFKDESTDIIKEMKRLGIR